VLPRVMLRGVPRVHVADDAAAHNGHQLAVEPHVLLFVAGQHAVVLAQQTALLVVEELPVVDRRCR
jgi:hypothetical protein